MCECWESRRWHPVLCPKEARTGLVLDHDTIDARNVDATFMINLNDPNVGGVEVSDNLLAGGGFTIVTEWRAGPSWLVSNNYVVDGTSAYGPASAENTLAPRVGRGTSS